MTFKTIFSDINKVAVARDSLSGIRFDSKNAVVVEAYKNAIKGLNEEQARYVLSKRYVSEADQADLLTKAEIIAANDGVKASELSRQLVLQGVRKEQAEALIEQVSGNEAITSNTVLTKEQTTAILEQAEARKFLSAQQRKNIADDIEETASSAQEASAEMAQASADIAESGTKMGSASSIIARSVSQLGVGFKSLLSIFVSSPVAVIATLTGSVIGLTYVIGKFQDTAKNAAKTASEFSSSMSSANSTYNKESDSLNDLTEKYEDLRKQLISAKGDEEKTYDIKSQLLELQEQLNDIYGDECDKVNLVTDAYKDQTAELKKNAKQKADNYLNTHVDEINEATKKMTTDYEYELGNFNYGLQDASVGNELHEQIKKLAEKSGIEWDDNKGFVFKGTAEEASKAIDQFMTDVRKLRDSEDGLSDGIINNLKAFDSSMSDQLGVANEIIDGYQETYETAQMAQIASDKDLSQGYNEVVSAVEAYNDAVSKSDNPYDDENVNKAWDNLQTVKSGIQSNEDEWGQYSNIMDKVFSSASDDVYSFYQAIQNDDSVKSLTNDLQGLTDIDLQSMANDDTEDSFDKLCKAAKKYGLEVQDVIDLLIQLGIVQGKVQEKNSNETPISPTSFEDAWTALDSTDEDAIKTLKKDLLEAAEAGQLSAEKFNELDKTEYFKNLGISADSAIEKINGLVNASTQLSSMSTQISKMSDMLADKKNGTVASASDLAGFDVSVRGLESWDEFERVMGDSTSTMDQCQEAANALATEWVNDGNFLSNLTDENKAYYETQLDQMGVANAQEVITDALARKHEEEAIEEEYAAAASQYNAQCKDGLNAVSANLAEVTAGEITRLQQEGIISADTADKISVLAVKKAIANGTTLDTSGDIRNLANLAGAATQLGRLLESLAKIKQGFTNGMPSDVAAKQAESYQKQIEAYLTGGSNKNIGANINLNVNPKGSRKYKDPSTPKKSKSESAKKTSQEFNLIEILINNINRSIDKLDAKISNTWSSWSKRNKALISEIKQVKKLENTQTKAANYYKKKASNVKLNSKTKKQLRDGAIDIRTVKDEKLANKMQKYQDYWESYKQYTYDAADSAQKYFDLLEQKFDDIQSKWDSRIGYQENRKNAVSDALNLAQSKGKLIGTAYYTKQKGINNKEINKYKQEETELKKAMKGVKKYSEQWYQYKADLSEVHSKYVQLQADNAELQRSINELKFDRFDELINKFGDITDEANFLIDMLDSDNLFNSDNGSITNDGITAMGLNAQNYDVYLAKAEQYKKQIADLEQMYKNGNGTIGYNDYISKLREYQQGMRDSIKSANDAKKAVISYVKQGLDAQNEALSKSIEKQKELLESERDLKEWQDKLADSNKNIAKLEKQKLALQGDDSEENRKRLQQIDSDLQDAYKDRSDMLYDRSVSDQEKALDDMLTKSQDAAENYLKNTNQVFVDALGYVNKNTSQVSQNLEKISKDLGYDISTYITNAWKDSGDAVGTYESTLSSNVPKITAQIQLITNAWNAQCEAANKAAQASAKAAAGSDETTKDTDKKSNSSSGSGNKSKTYSAKDIKKYITDHADKAKQKKPYYGVLNRYLHEKTGGKVLSVSEEVQLAKMLGVSVKKDLSGTGDRQKILDALKKKKIAFANGGVLGDLVKLSGEDGLFIGSAGESILTKEQTKALINFRPVIPQLNTMVDLMKNVPIGRGVTTSEPHIEINTTVEGVATDQIVKEMEGVAQRQAENVVRKINQATYAKGVRR